MDSGRPGLPNYTAAADHPWDDSTVSSEHEEYVQPVRHALMVPEARRQHYVRAE